MSAVLAAVLLAGACGQDGAGGTDASSEDASPQEVPEDRDQPTPAPAVPEREEGCDEPPSVDAAQQVATGSALSTIDRIAAPSLADISAAAPTVLIGTIVGVEQGEVRPADPGASLMANVLLQVDHAEGPLASDLSAEEVVALPFTLLPQAPAGDRYAEHRDVTHANLTNTLRCAMPKVDAAAFVTHLGPKPAEGAPRIAELPTVLGSTEPGAIVLQAGTDNLVSLDASVVGDPDYFAGATTVDQLTDPPGRHAAGPS